jgi:hypothetical protein
MAVRRIAELSELEGLALHTGRHLGPVLLVFILLPVGLIVLAVGLGRAGVLPYWLAFIDAIGMAGIAGSLQYPVALVLSGSPLVASFGFASLKLLRTRVGAIGGGPGVTASVCGAPQPVSRS